MDSSRRPGSAWILNDPYRGGTHLPDITLINPVFDAAALLGFAASRAHHSDVGGPTPGGMPAHSIRLEEEGLIIPPTRADDRTLRELAAQMRAPAQRLADLRAQAAANRIGALRLGELAESHGPPRLRAGMAATLDYAERRTRAALAALPDGSYRAEDVLEDDFGATARDLTLRLVASDRGENLRLDFSGTDPQVEGNLNCPLSVTKSAAFFAVRALSRPRCTALGRCLPPDRGDRPNGVPAKREPSGGRRRRQRGDLQPCRGPDDRGARRRPRGACPRARGR